MMRLLPAGATRPGLRGADRRDRRVDRVEDQFDRDDLHARPLCQGAGRPDPRRGRPVDASGQSIGAGRPDRRRARRRDRAHCGHAVARQLRTRRSSSSRNSPASSRRASRVIFLLGLFWTRGDRGGRDRRGDHLGPALLYPQRWASLRPGCPERLNAWLSPVHEPHDVRVPGEPVPRHGDLAAGAGPRRRRTGHDGRRQLSARPPRSYSAAWALS